MTTAFSRITGQIETEGDLGKTADGRRVLSAKLMAVIEMGKKPHVVLETIVHDLAASRVKMWSVSYFDADMKIILSPHSDDLGIESWADDNFEIQGRLAVAEIEVKRAIVRGQLDADWVSKSTLFEAAARVPVSERA